MWMQVCSIGYAYRLRNQTNLFRSNELVGWFGFTQGIFYQDYLCIRIIFTCQVHCKFITILFFYYLRALVQCHLDGNRHTEASNSATHALAFIRNNFPSMFKELFGIVVSFSMLITYQSEDHHEPPFCQLLLFLLPSQVFVEKESKQQANQQKVSMWVDSICYLWKPSSINVSYFGVLTPIFTFIELSSENTAISYCTKSNL